MVKITIEIPEELEFIKKLPSTYWTIAASNILKAKINEIAEIIKIAEKSKAKEKDAEELTNEIKEAVWEHYK